MLFIHPMWDNESERVGMQKCTPLGYRLHHTGEGVGFFGLLLLLATFGYWCFRWWERNSQSSMYWLMVIPFAFGLVSEVLVQLSWKMARGRGFTYDHQRAEASWVEDGERRTFIWQRNATTGGTQVRATDSRGAPE